MIREVAIAGRFRIGGGNPPAFIAGPCVLESEGLAMAVAEVLSELFSRLGVPLVFKGSFDKANRSSGRSFRGPGQEEGLRILGDIKRKFRVPVTTDVHDPRQAAAAAEVVDLLQIPALLCRQTDLLVAAGETGLPVNLKKGQFMAPWDMENAVEKVTSTGNPAVLVTERGTTFGYNNLVVDFRGLPAIREGICPVIFDATHSVQLPGGAGKSSSGERRFVAPLARAAVAAGVDGVFFEVHPDPDRALSDGPNSLPLDDVEPLLRTLLAIREAADSGAAPKRRGT
ncbi:MAG TPA: 3-deoxy-8-phosphooctulonate synthase [Candidatus Limnocylindrales bacterium]|nr:3-deoxy-8-phosphooctulonate synthase [Candidatus Limnocylindrales bacterium]